MLIEWAVWLNEQFSSWFDEQFDVIMFWLDEKFDVIMFWLDEQFDVIMFRLDEQFARKQGLCEEVLEVFNVILPGKCWYLYLRATPLSVRHFRHML